VRVADPLHREAPTACFTRGAEKTRAAVSTRIRRSWNHTLEAKSGYGLDWKNELAILKLLGELQREQPLEIVRTFLAPM